MPTIAPTVEVPLVKLKKLIAKCELSGGNRAMFAHGPQPVLPSCVCLWILHECTLQELELG